jgi:hypothetical protein
MDLGKEGSRLVDRFGGKIGPTPRPSSDRDLTIRISRDIVLYFSLSIFIKSTRSSIVVVDLF